MLPNRQQFQQCIELRAVADAAANVRLVVADTETVNEGFSRGGRKLARENRQRGRFAGTVNT